MNEKTTTINVKINTRLKEEAKTLASEMGLNLSGVVNGLLTQFVRDRELNLSVDKTQKLLNELKEIEKGEFSPEFSSAEEAIAWLDK